MARFIAHRGNLTGPNPTRENDPDYVYEALKQGFDVEVDIWRVGPEGKGSWWLGHDKPGYPVDFSFLKQKGIWCHAKNFHTYRALRDYNIPTFFQEVEKYVITTNGYLWWHEGQIPYADASKQFSILTALSVKDAAWLPEGYYGLCTDYALYCRDGEPVTDAPEPSLHQERNPFKILFLDVDGVLSANKIYDQTHKVIGKMFCDKDFTAIKRMKAAGVEVVILSGDDWNEAMAKKRNIKFIWTPARDGVISKVGYAENYALDQGIILSECAYIGDDYYDISLLEKVGFAYCPADAIKAVKEVAFSLTNWSGEGCIAEIYDRLKWDENYPYDNL